MSKRLFLVATAWALLLPAAAFGQQAADLQDHGRILGVVTSSGNVPLIAADVALRNAADSTIVRVATGPDGRFLIDNVAFGTYSLRINFVGYRPRTFVGVVLSKTSPLADLGAITLDATMIAREESPNRK